jgi:hypothetical protein
MTFRYNENDISTSGANKILQLDSSGKIPTLDGSAITGLTSTSNNGKSYTYLNAPSTNFVAENDKFYYIYQANKKVSNGGEVVTITLPYINCTTGTKCGFEYIPQTGATTGGQYKILVKDFFSHDYSGTGGKITPDGVRVFIDGQVYTPTGNSDYEITLKGGSTPARQFYCRLNTTENIGFLIVEWYSFDAGTRKLSDLWNCNINNRYTKLADGSTEIIAQDIQNATVTAITTSGSLVNTNQKTTTRVYDTNNSVTSLALAFNNNTLKQGYRNHLLLQFRNGTSGTTPPAIYVPPANIHKGIQFMVKSLRRSGNDVASGWQYNQCYINIATARVGVDVFLPYLNGSTASSIFGINAAKRAELGWYVGDILYNIQGRYAGTSLYANNVVFISDGSTRYYYFFTA